MDWLLHAVSIGVYLHQAAVDTQTTVSPSVASQAAQHGSMLCYHEEPSLLLTVFVNTGHSGAYMNGSQAACYYKSLEVLCNQGGQVDPTAPLLWGPKTLLH